MSKYIVRRLLLSIPVLFGVTLLIYVFLEVAPGDPVLAKLRPQDIDKYGEEWVEQQREMLGLNNPWPVRYVLWLKDLFRGNLGYSFASRQAVAQEIGRLIGPTLKLTASALVLATVLSLIVGIVSAMKQYSLLDHTLTLLSFTGLSLPAFFSSLVLVYVFAIKLRILPSGGMRTYGQDPTFGDSLKHLLLPVTALALPSIAGLARYVRSSVIDVLRLDYVTVARAKGLSERAVITRHVLRNSLLPFVTITGLRIPGMLGGAVIVEHVFAWPGLGEMGIQAVQGHDYPMVMAFNLITAVAVFTSNLVTDITYAFIDPRIRYD